MGLSRTQRRVLEWRVKKRHLEREMPIHRVIMRWNHGSPLDTSEEIAEWHLEYGKVVWQYWKAVEANGGE